MEKIDKIEKIYQLKQQLCNKLNQIEILRDM